MSEKYKTTEDGLYFVSFSVVGFMDVFTRRKYQEILVESFIFCQLQKGLKLYCYCIMTNHIHFIAASENGSLSNILRDFKSFTATEIMDAISKNIQESRKEWLQAQFKNFGSKSPQKQINQFWKHDNHPFFLYSREMIEQKVNYIHHNPVEAGFVNEPHEWRLSSANEQSPIKVLKF
ncbi:MAG: REP-associated tyrosine transposase [Bacteroidota bacterium]